MDIKIIGVGFPRTGTSSLRTAIQELGFQDSRYSNNLIDSLKLNYWWQLERKGVTQWDKLFGDQSATVHFLNAFFFKDLFQQYPDAKVVLATRCFDELYESIKATFWERKTAARTNGRYLYKLEGTERWEELSERWINKKIFIDFFENRFLDKNFARYKYNLHLEEIKSIVPTSQLLTFNLNDGYTPLCAFLSRPQPNEDFPHRGMNKNLYLQLKNNFKPQSLNAVRCLAN